MSSDLNLEEEKRLQTLINALADQHISVGWNACRDLAKLGDKASLALPLLSEKLSNPDANTVLWARFAIAKITGDVSAQMPYFISAISDKKRLYPGMASAALAGLGQLAITALPALIEELADPNPENRWSAAHAIAGLGGHAQIAASSLANLLHDPDEKVRWYAAHALSEIVPENDEIVPELILGLQDIDDDVRGYCAVTLGRMGSIAALSVPILESMLTDANPNIVLQAQASLTHILQAQTE